MALCQPGLTFEHLKRLSFIGYVRLSDRHSTDENVLNPDNMPNLRHLAIMDLNKADLFSEILPQLLTLAIASPGSPFFTLSHVITKLGNLKHLSMPFYDQAIPHLFFSGAAQLESLHLAVSSFEYHSSLPSLLNRIVKERKEIGKSARIVMYGSQRTFHNINGLYNMDLSDLGHLVWKTDSNCPPFENFDGQ